ncbi:DUF1254 domain-containing protein [Tenacibaculum sp. UWU-22]|uniref:DUF1254 domain-containing protein n=1 Tax=Tenacibaculum sp. UWU-22 TaxID=3234187 RepID=UPI0034DAD29C
MKKFLFTLFVPLFFMSCKSSAQQFKSTIQQKPSYAKEMTADGKILVDESNFTIAETDRYMSDHASKYPLNVFHHIRKMSSKDNQVVVRENQDVMYSRALVDVTNGATFINPAWDQYSVIQINDENEYIVGVVYPGEQLTVTPKDLALGHHVFVNMRTGLRSLDAAGYDEAHKHQDAVVIKANSAIPYKPKAFDKVSLKATRDELKARANEDDKPRYYFGTKEEVAEHPKQFLIASALGIFGLPIKDAAYLNTIQPPVEARSGACASLTLPVPPLQFNKGGFFSVTTYDSKGWIVKDNFALNNNQATPNDDGTYTFHFNCPGTINNMNVVQDWTVLIRLYRPVSADAVLEYMKSANKNIKIELIKQ